MNFEQLEYKQLIKIIFDAPSLPHPCQRLAEGLVIRKTPQEIDLFTTDGDIVTIPQQDIKTFNVIPKERFHFRLNIAEKQFIQVSLL